MGVIVLLIGGIAPRVVVLGGSCPGGNRPRGSCPMGVIDLRGSCPQGSCLRGSCPRGNCPRGSCPVTKWVPIKNITTTLFCYVYIAL